MDKKTFALTIDYILTELRISNPNAHKVPRPPPTPAFVNHSKMEKLHNKRNA